MTVASRPGPEGHEAMFAATTVATKNQGTPSSGSERNVPVPDPLHDLRETASASQDSAPAMLKWVKVFASPVPWTTRSRSLCAHTACVGLAECCINIGLGGGLACCSTTNPSFVGIGHRQGQGSSCAWRSS